MKKFIFALFVALLSTVTFTSCTDEDYSDSELTANILSNATYTGTDNADDAATLELEQTTYTLEYDELGVFSTGTWTVTNGTLILTGEDYDSPSCTGTINKGGDELTITSGSITFTMKKD
ncbi:MAG: hypothetical protein JW922_00680 [Paludibacteraceae bacterium]|nr:hypothetical protein [Paludibacteraceae bacterium]